MTHTPFDDPLDDFDPEILFPDDFPLEEE